MPNGFCWQGRAGLGSMCLRDTRTGIFSTGDLTSIILVMCKSQSDENISSSQTRTRGGMLNGIKKLHLEHLILLALLYPLGILTCIIRVAVVQCVYRICLHRGAAGVVQCACSPISILLELTLCLLQTRLVMKILDCDCGHKVSNFLD